MKKALIAIDASEVSRSLIRFAFRYASNQAIPEIDFIHVFEMPPLMSTGRSGIDVPDVSDFREKKAQEIREKFMTIIREELKSAEITETPWNLLVHFGTPYDKIVAAAEEGGYGIILIGHRGMSNIKRFIIGSVAAKVARHAPCDVLIHRPRKD